MAGRDFEGWVVLVTGASTGLGRAIAVDTAERGAGAVVINYASSQDEAEETARRVEAHGARAILARGDVASDEDCRRIAAAAAPLGRIDALFNNAGITKFANNHADLDAVSADDFQRLYAVNVVGAFQMIRAARSLLEAAPRAGAVVNTASVAGVIGIGSSVPYAASKGALLTMTIDAAESRLDRRGHRRRGRVPRLPRRPAHHRRNTARGCGSAPGVCAAVHALRAGIGFALRPLFFAWDKRLEVDMEFQAPRDERLITRGDRASGRAPRPPRRPPPVRTATRPA
jgi:NAD(P)-dependent dehydrogenase (short-subunit alcohol dehydrogenase family)